MIDIQSGDVVVCVKDGGNLCSCGCGEPRVIALGRLYRVEDVFFITETDEVGLFLLGLPNVSENHLGYTATSFRKVLKADESFTADIRACRPIRTPVEA